MKMTRELDRLSVVERGIEALYSKLGPADAKRFFSVFLETNREDSVDRHRKWQRNLDQNSFLKRVRAAYAKAARK